MMRVNRRTPSELRLRLGGVGTIVAACLGLLGCQAHTELTGRQAPSALDGPRKTPKDGAVDKQVATFDNLIDGADRALAKGDASTAERVFRLGRTLAEEEVAKAPTDAWWQARLALVLQRVAARELARADLVNAEKTIAEQCRAAEAGWRLAPTNLAHRRDVAIAYEQRAHLEWDKGDLVSAQATNLQAVAVAEELIAADPSNHFYQRSVFIPLSRFALLVKPTSLDKAASALGRCVEIAQRVVDSGSGDLKDWGDLLVSAILELGDVRERQGQLEEAEHTYLRAIRAAKLVSETGRAELIETLLRHASLAQRLKHFPAAASSLRQALVLSSSLAQRPKHFSAAEGSLGQALALSVWASSQDSQSLPDDDLVLKEALVLARLGGLSQAQNDQAAAKRQFGASLASAQKHAKAVAGAPDAVQERTGDALIELGDVLREYGRLAEAEQLLDVAFELATRQDTSMAASRSWPRRRLLVLARRSALQGQRGQRAEALRLAQEAVSLARDIAEGAPDEVQATHDLVGQLVDLGDLQVEAEATEEAIKSFMEAAMASQAVYNARGDSRSLRQVLLARQRLGDVEDTLGRSAEALTDYQVAVGAARRLVELEGGGDSEMSLATCLVRVGEAQTNLKDFTEAERSIAQGYALAQRLARAEPTNVYARNVVCRTLRSLGAATRSLGRMTEAKHVFTDSLACAREVAVAFPKDTAAQRSLVDSYQYLADLARDQKEFESAEGHLSAAILVAEKLARADGSNLEAQDDLAVVLDQLSWVQILAGRLRQAEPTIRRALAIREMLTKKDASLKYRAAYANTVSNLGVARKRAGDTKAGRDLLVKARNQLHDVVKAAPDNAEWRRWLDEIEQELQPPAVTNVRLK